MANQRHPDKVQVGAYFTKEEREIMHRAATARGINLTQYLRLLLLGEEPESTKAQESQEPDPEDVTDTDAPTKRQGTTYQA